MNLEQTNVVSIRKLEFAFESVILIDRKRAYGLIVLKDTITGDYDVHYLTEFLVEKYRNAKYETIKKRAYQLNWHPCQGHMKKKS
ncbi:hypothetical protein [Bacillus sp. MRMR6]|uniref:hypothetical protein n=1 Tax=Bacillus sp. MRMR6 TaxID=1928617 RepID=UPI000950F129|nr:hypothetical protein [Bacillus sp. MRMR6]OLS40297.1 hypothetical protein BTR25_10850 [Bacillus sp. MRMR6]